MLLHPAGVHVDYLLNDLFDAMIQVGPRVLLIETIGRGSELAD